MSQPKILIAYYSTYGTNHQTALTAAEAARAAGAEVRVRKFPETAPEEVVASQDAWKAHADKTSDVAEATLEDMDWADGYFFSVPTRFGSPASQAAAFIDTLGPLWAEGKLANKTFTATTSAQNPHGGQETTLQQLYITAMHWGAILVAPGYTDESLFAAGGNPYGVSITADGSGLTEDEQKAVGFQARRLTEVTAKLGAEEPVAVSGD